MIKASQMMNKTYLTITPDMGVDELARLFSRKHISGAVVVNKKGKLLGVVTESDLIAKEKNLHLPTVVSIFDAVMPPVAAPAAAPITAPTGPPSNPTNPPATAPNSAP